MRRFFAAFMIMTGLFAFMGVESAAAYVSPGVNIDGQSRMFNPPCQIVAGRTMIPIRYVIEDPALQGTVNWDGANKKVNIVCRGKSFAFQIARSQVTVDGQMLNLEVAPYIYQGRTYIPLRFLTEQLGARVSWNNPKRVVNINFNPLQRSEVFAYYYRSFTELEENADLISDLALRWFETNANGDLFYEYQDNYDQILQFAHNNGMKAHASVVFMDREGMHTLLSSSSNRSRLVAALAAQVAQNGYDGVNIDFEFLGKDDRNNFTLFLRELKNTLGTDKELSVALFACTKPESWLAGYDYPAIGEIADRVVIMAYDYSYKGSTAGPVAPLWWVEDVVAYTQSIIPAEKLLLGLPTYGYDWGNGLTTTSVTAGRLQTLKEQYPLTEYFDQASMSPYYAYVDSNGISHQIWLENKTSLNAKLDIALNHQLAGVSFWRIGNGFNDLYQLLEQKLPPR